METASPLNTEVIDGEPTPKSRRESLVTDDRTIYKDLIAPLETMMMRTIWRIVRNADLVDDCLQDALAIVWKKRRRIILHPNPQALILRICLNAAYDSLRQLDRVRRKKEMSCLAGADTVVLPGAEDNLEEKEIEQQVQQAVRRLPRKRALAVMMRLIYEESFEEIARVLNCSEVTARIHVSRGRAQLRQWLSPLCQSKRKEVYHE